MVVVEHSAASRTSPRDSALQRTERKYLRLFWWSTCKLTFKIRVYFYGFLFHMASDDNVLLTVVPDLKKYWANSVSLGTWVWQKWGQGCADNLSLETLALQGLLEGTLVIYLKISSAVHLCLYQVKPQTHVWTSERLPRPQSFMHFCKWISFILVSYHFF